MKSLLITVISLVPIACIIAQPDRLDKAIQLSHNGEFDAAEIIFDSLSRSNTLDNKLLNLSKAYNYSWSKQYAKAAILFKELIRQYPDNLEALVGLGYNYNWAGDYPNAIPYFKSAIAKDPDNKSARIGLIHNYIDRGYISAAKRVVRDMAQKYPIDAETKFLEGQIAIHESKNRKAVKLLRTALELDPNNQGIKDQLDTYGAISSKYAVTIWHGSSKVDDKFHHGLRRFDFSYQPNNKALFYALYDNSLFMQNSFVAATERTAPYIGIGGKYGWNIKWFSKIELGHRFFTDQENQSLFNLENTYFFSDKMIVTAHVMYDDRQIEQLIIGGLSADIGITKNIRFTTSYYHSENQTTRTSYSQRLILAPKFLIQKFEIIGGLFYDRIFTTELSERKIAGFYSLLSFPLVDELDGRILFSHDDGFFNQKNTLYSVGLNYKFQ